MKLFGLLFFAFLVIYVLIAAVWSVMIDNFGSGDIVGGLLMLVTLVVLIVIVIYHLMK